MWKPLKRLNRSAAAWVTGFIVALSPKILLAQPACVNLFASKAAIQLSRTENAQIAAFNVAFGPHIATHFNYNLASTPREPVLLVSDVIRKDLAQGSAKAAALEELGFRLEEDEGKRPDGPSFMQISRNYHEGLKRRGFRFKDIIRPGMVFFGYPDGQLDCKVLDPNVDSLPDPNSGYQLLSSSRLFNIPFRAIIEALKEGKWPLMEELHDVSHFIAFLRFPVFVRSVLEAVRNLTESDYTSGFKRRLFWLMETMSLPDFASRSEIIEFLRNKRGLQHGDSLAKIRSSAARISDSDLATYADELATFFGSVQADFSGGTSMSREKYDYIGSIFGVSTEAAFNLELPPAPAMNLARAYVQNDKVPQIQWHKSTASEIFVFSFTTMSLTLKALSQGLKVKDDDVLAQHFTSAIIEDEGESAKPYVDFISTNETPQYKLKPGVRAEMRSLTRELIARLEYALLRTTDDLTVETWAHSMLQADLPANSNLGSFIRQVFTNDTVTRYYLGRGEKRAKE